MTENETPTFKEWQLLQIEGEELQPIQEVAVDKNAKKAPAGKGKQQEEVVDNRPRTVMFKRDFAEEQQSGL